MSLNFAPIGQAQNNQTGENSFWPSFTDIMMVITMIFLMATSILVVRNWQLVAELRESIAAEQVASQVIENTSLENATLEERLANAEQSNSIFRLRLLHTEEALRVAQDKIRSQQTTLVHTKLEQEQLNKTLMQANQATDIAKREIERIKTEKQTMASSISTLKHQLAQHKQQSNEALTELASAQQEIRVLVESGVSQQESISGLTQEKLALNQEIEAYNLQLLSLIGDYETVKSKYENLIKPARSAKGKYIAEVYYVRGQQGEVIRYKQPGYAGFVDLSLEEVETRLSELKQQKGDDLYVKIIIPEDSGLTYNEAWDFMRNLLSKYDYYY